MRRCVFLAMRRPWGRLLALVAVAIPAAAVLLAPSRPPTYTLTVLLRNPSVADEVHVFSGYWPTLPSVGNSVSPVPWRETRAVDAMPTVFMLPQGS